jgi:ankyrin repeat protein
MNLFRRKVSVPPAGQLGLAIDTSDTVTIRKILSCHPELLNQPDEKGSTPLHRAAERQDLSVVAALVDLGADVTLKDHFGYTPRDTAYFFGEFRMGAYTDICQKIIKRLGEPGQSA